MLLTILHISDPEKIEKITNSLSITLPPAVIRSKDPRNVLTTVFAAWLPLSTAVLVSAIEYLPSPPSSQAERLPSIIDESPGASFVDPHVRSSMIGFQRSKEDPVVAYVSKMIAIRESELPENKRKGGILTAEEARDLGRKRRAEIARSQAAERDESTLRSMTGAFASTGITGVSSDDDSIKSENEDPEHLIGFARIYSGTLSVGDEVYVLPPKFSPAHPHTNPEPQKVMITALYLLMGRGLEPLTSVPAGVVFGVAGLEGHILKSGTICSQLSGSVNLAGISIGSKPIVRVALEPVNPSELDKMIAGMKLLEQSDPCALYEVLDNGEHVILTAGELHLERCLKDLRERFAKCEIQASEPIVPYRETIISASEMEPPKNKDLPRGTVSAVTISKQIAIRTRVKPLPQPVITFLEKHAGAIKRLYSEHKAAEEGKRLGNETPQEVAENDGIGDADEDAGLSFVDFKAHLKLSFEKTKAEREVWANVIEKIAAFGPRRVGPNLLIDNTKQGACNKL